MRHHLFFARPLHHLSLSACLLLVAISGRCRAEDWSLPDSRMGIRTAPLLLMTRPDVQSDLGLKPAQVASVHKTIDELSQRAQSLRGRTGTEVVAERRVIDETQGKWLNTNLSERQLERLSQIDLQWEGSSALVSRATIVDMLKLDGQQVRELTRLLADRNARIIKSGFNPAEETATRRQALAILSNPQLQAWNGILGERCQFTADPPAAPVVDPAAQQAEHVAPR